MFVTIYVICDLRVACSNQVNFFGGEISGE